MLPVGFSQREENSTHRAPSFSLYYALPPYYLARTDNGAYAVVSGYGGTGTVMRLISARGLLFWK
jgi:hypothetical protein